MSDIGLVERLRPLVAMLSEGSVRWGVVPESPEQLDIMRRNFEKGSGDIHGVILPEHPKHIGGTDPDRPTEAVWMFTTGNGPKSKDNAQALCEIITILKNEMK